MDTSSELGTSTPSHRRFDELDAAWQAVLGSIAAARRSNGEALDGGTGVTLLAGFLGSGKTTVLRRLLSDPAGLRIAAVVNDVGAVNVDAASLNFTAGVDGDSQVTTSAAADRIELTNGCACCALADDLATSLEPVGSGGGLRRHRGRGQRRRRPGDHGLGSTRRHGMPARRRTGRGGRAAPGCSAGRCPDRGCGPPPDRRSTPSGAVEGRPG